MLQPKEEATRNKISKVVPFQDIGNKLPKAKKKSVGGKHD